MREYRGLAFQMTASVQQIAQWIDAAQAASARGDFGAAVQLCRQSLAAAPNVAEAWYHLAIALRGLDSRAAALEALQRAQALAANSADAQNSIGLELLGLDARDEAQACFERAIALEPRHAFSHSNLGSLLAGMERHAEAESAFRRAIALQPNLAPAHANLGGILNRRKQYEAAEQACRKAIELDSRSAEAWSNLGSALNGQKKLEQAASACRKAVELEPRLQQAWGNLGSVLCELACFGDAELASRKGLELGDAPQLWNNLAGALVGLKQYQAAEAAALKAIALSAESPQAWCNLSGARLGQNRYQAAEEAGLKAVALDASSAVAWCNLATALLEQYRLVEAEAACARAIGADPQLALPRTVMARIHLERGQSREAAAEFERALEIAPQDLTILSRWLFWMNYLPGVLPAQMLAIAQAFGQAVRRDVVADTTWECRFEGQRKLRIGLVSGDFRRHPVGYLLKGPLRHIDKSRFEIHAYSNHAVEDEVTAELRALCEGWTNVVAMHDARLAEQIRKDRIDILLDLMGHTEHGRLALFARRPAPVQASWLGYFATTGVGEIDWKIGDGWISPAAEAGHFTEKVWRLPDSCFCFSPPAGAPCVSAPPAARNGFITYGCFNNLAKMTDQVVELWSRILKEDGTARLMLKAQQLRSEDMRRSVRERYAAQGIAPERLQLDPSGAYLDYLHAYEQVDIALDPFPFTGGATTADALWMGVPVVTLRGDRFVAHQGESLLHAAGLANWIAGTRDEYVMLALSYAADRPALSALRSRLREQAGGSPLFDARRYARNVEECWRGMWLDMCRARDGSP